MPPHALHPLAGLSDLGGADRVLLLVVAAVFVLPPALVLFLTRRVRDPRLHEGCGEVAPAVIPAVALWAVTLYAVRVATIVLHGPGWLRMSVTLGAPTFLMLPLLIAGMLLAAMPTRPMVLIFTGVCLLTLAADAWLLQLPAHYDVASIDFNPSTGWKVVLYVVMWLAAAPLPLLVIAVPMMLMYVIFFGVRLLKGDVRE